MLCVQPDCRLILDVNGPFSVKKKPTNKDNSLNLMFLIFPTAYVTTTQRASILAVNFK